jgi:hypothetical protein
MKDFVTPSFFVLAWIVAAVILSTSALAQNPTPTNLSTPQKTGCDVKFFKTVGGQQVPTGTKHIEEGGTYTSVGNYQKMMCRNGKIVKVQP